MFRKRFLPHNWRIKDRKVDRRGQKSGRDKEMNVVRKEREKERVGESELVWEGGGKLTNLMDCTDRNTVPRTLAGESCSLDRP